MLNTFDYYPVSCARLCNNPFVRREKEILFTLAFFMGEPRLAACVPVLKIPLRSFVTDDRNGNDSHQQKSMMKKDTSYW